MILQFQQHHSDTNGVAGRESFFIEKNERIRGEPNESGIFVRSDRPDRDSIQRK